MPIPLVCAIARQTCSALDAAHRLGLVHRDIKPSNLIVCETPLGSEIKVLDFGIAKLKETQHEASRIRQLTMTGTGLAVGTPAYMSPEQATGRKGDELDGRSDLYSLGIVMYQMFTGELPIKADSELQMLIAQINATPVPLREVRLAGVLDRWMGQR